MRISKEKHVEQYVKRRKTIKENELQGGMVARALPLVLRLLRGATAGGTSSRL
jgi:hypothetical protein